MEVLASSNKDLTITEIAAALGVHRTIAHRLIATLERRDLVSRSSVGRYRLGAGLVRLAGAIGGELRSIARPYLIKLNDETDETVHLAVLARSNIVFVDSFESSKALRIVSRIGRLYPTHASSMGKAILATMTDEELAKLFPGPKLEKVAPGTLTSRAQLFVQLQSIRESGYATNFEETEEGLGAVAVAIIDRHGSTCAALSVAAPITRFTTATIPRLTKAALRAAKDIGGQL